jgi:hypothetical protein
MFAISVMLFVSVVFLVFVVPVMSLMLLMFVMLPIPVWIVLVSVYEACKTGIND